jgi:hypothetical protein
MAGSTEGLTGQKEVRPARPSPNKKHKEKKNDNGNDPRARTRP